MYLLVNAGALLVFIAGLVCALAFSVVWPLALVALALAILASGQIQVGARLFATSLSIWFGSWARSFELLRAIGQATLPGGLEVPPEAAVPLAMLPVLRAVLDELTQRLRTGAITSVVVTLEANAAVSFERQLTLGLPLLYAMSGDELRAVLAHEIGHIRAWHTWTGRVVHACIFRLDRSLSSADFSLLSPVTWVALAWLAFLKATYFRWRRSHEFEADLLAAHCAGGNHLISSLRTVREKVHVLSLALAEVARLSQRTKAMPSRVVETAARLALRIPESERRRLSRHLDGDPLDFEDQTHPPVPQRIAALQHAPVQEARFPRRALLEFTDVARLEEALSRRALRGRVLSPVEFLAACEEHESPEGESWKGAVQFE